MNVRRRPDRRYITLARALSKFGLSSRSLAGGLIRQGRVRVDGQLVNSPEAWVNPAVDCITVDGTKLRHREFAYIALNKPVDVVTTRSDERGRQTVYNFLPKHQGWLFPVGRLDKETSGLLLFTNDTRFGNVVTSPLEKVPKTYEVVLDKPLSEAVRLRLQSPMKLEDGTVLKPAIVRVSTGEPKRCTVTIVEGRNRQIRRMFEKFAYRVRALHRVSIGSLQMGDLGMGKTRYLTIEEVADLTAGTG